MRHLRKGKRAERAHQYRVIANRLAFQLERRHFVREPEIIRAVETARDALLKAAELLQRADERDDQMKLMQKRAS